MILCKNCRTEQLDALPFCHKCGHQHTKPDQAYSPAPYAVLQSSTEIGFQTSVTRSPSKAPKEPRFVPKTDVVEVEPVFHTEQPAADPVRKQDMTPDKLHFRTKEFVVAPLPVPDRDSRTAQVSESPCPQSGPSFTIPNRIPWSLRLAEPRLPAFGGLIGIMLGLATSVLVYRFAGEETMLGRVFDLRGFSAAIPVSISCMFFWGAAVCFLRWLRIRTLEPISSRIVLQKAVQFLSANGAEKLVSEIKGPICVVSPLHRRLQAVLRQWLSRPSLQDADVILRQYAANDEDALYTGYNLVRTFIWAMPVLGLIGTVIGISLAVGGFAQFLGGNVEDVRVIKNSLVGVTSGLSFAFLITLQGLLGALLTMLPSSALQAREDRMYASTQHGIVDVLLPAIQQIAPEVSTKKEHNLIDERSVVSVWSETLHHTAKEVLTEIQNNYICISQMMDEKRAEQRKEIEQWTETLYRELKAGAELLGESVGRIGVHLANASTDPLKNLHLAAEILGQQVVALRDHQTTEAQTTKQYHDKMIEAMSEHSESLRGTADALVRLTGTTVEVLAGQTTLQAAVQQLHDTGFQKTLTQFRESLMTLGQVLQRLREPHVMQWVPIPDRPRGEVV